MFLRALLWLVTLGALAAALASERAPSDPSRDPAPALSRSRQVLIVSQAGRTPLPPWLTPSTPDNYGAPAEMVCCCAASDVVADYARLLQGALLAEDHALAETVFAPSLVVRPPWALPSRGPVCLYPTWDLRELCPAAPEGSLPQTDLGRAVQAVAIPHIELTLLPGAVAVVGDAPSIPAVESFWNDCRRSRWPHDPAAAAESALVEFHDTHLFEPLRQNERPRSVALEDYLQRHRHVEAAVRIVPGGLVSIGRPEKRTAVREFMQDARLIRLVRALEEGTLAQRFSARRAALGDDDPQFAQFALHDLTMSPMSETIYMELQGLAPEYLETSPFRAGGKLTEEQEWLVLVALEQLAPAQAAAEIERLARTTIDADSLAPVLGNQLGLAMAPEVRQAVMGAILARLPRGVLNEYKRHALPVERWTEAEITGFFRLLVERLREELADGDSQRAAYFTVATLTALDRTPFYMLRPGDASHSRLIELGADLALDERLGVAFRQPWPQPGHTIREVYLELTHNSDPEVRYGALRALVRLGVSPENIEALAGDPFTANLVEGVLSKSTRHRSKPSH